MKTLFALLILFFSYSGFSQNKKKESNSDLLKELSENACKCIDSISTVNKSHDETAKEVSRCIDNQTGAFQLGSKLMGIDLEKDSKGKKKKKNINVSIDLDNGSDEYKSYYYEMERYLMDNCEPIKTKIASTNKENEKSFSLNPQALELYSKGLDESKKENYKEAVSYYQQALKIDSLFVFAWDNLGLSYRKLGELDKALEAYRRSLEIDPTGSMPLQNIAIVYQYKKEYQKAVEAFEKLAEVDKNNPEVYYGIGQIYATNLLDNEKALINMCKAYVIYVAQKSPYRTDAESVINMLYTEMKKQGKEARFAEILKENNIKTQ